MPRVSQETLDKLKVFIDSLPDEARDKCALCNETLTHLVKTAEVETGAGTATVTRELANKINETAAPGDRVGDEALKKRVQRSEGVIRTKRPDTHQPKEKAPDGPELKKGGDFHTDDFAMRFAKMAVAQLASIERGHPDRKQAFDYVVKWIELNR